MAAHGPIRFCNFDIRSFLRVLLGSKVFVYARLLSLSFFFEKGNGIYVLPIRVSWTFLGIS